MAFFPSDVIEVGTHFDLQPLDPPHYNSKPWSSLFDDLPKPEAAELAKALLLHSSL